MDGLLSQEEINALFNSADDDTEETVSAASSPTTDLSADEKDAIGEISNISMGSSATTLAALVNQKVDISTPVVRILTWDQLVSAYDKPCIFIQILYKEGLDGNNILILKENDVKIIASLMMGGDGSITDEPLGEMHLSAISEAMNQMMGAASTSISSMIETKVDITPPSANVIDIATVKDAGDIADFLKGEFCQVAFKMKIGDLVDSTLMQLYPIQFAKDLYRKFTGGEEPPKAASSPAPAPAAAPSPAPAPAQAQPQQDMSQMGNPAMAGGMPQMMQGMGMMNPQMMNPQMYAQTPEANVYPAQFSPFMQVQSPLLQTENIDLLLDVPLEVSVELGRTSKSIKEILDFAPGTVVELNRLAGEPIDVLVNGKYVAKGEVVVIGESFGVRITSVIK